MTYERTQRSGPPQPDGTGAGASPTPRQAAPVPHYQEIADLLAERDRIASERRYDIADRISKACAVVTVICWCVIAFQIGTTAYAALNNFDYENGAFPHE